MTSNHDVCLINKKRFLAKIWSMKHPSRAATLSCPFQGEILWGQIMISLVHIWYHQRCTSIRVFFGKLMYLVDRLQACNKHLILLFSYKEIDISMIVHYIQEICRQCTLCCSLLGFDSDRFRNHLTLEYSSNFSKCNFIFWYYSPWQLYFSMKQVQYKEYLFSQHCGYWWPGALAPGHQ